MNTLNGFIKIHRKLIDWGWYSDYAVKDTFVHLLLTANFRDRTYMGYEIKAGQTVIGLKQMSEDTGLSIQQIRTALKKLESTGEITKKSTNKFTIVTIENWTLYQLDDESATNEQQTNNKRTTNDQQHLKNDKNDKNDKKDIYSAEAQQIIDYLNQKAGTTYRYTSKKNQTLIKARMDEHFTVEDFKKVIDIKVSEWKETDMAQYLRPITLFGTKFESYLNQKPQQSNNESDKIPWAKIP